MDAIRSDEVFALLDEAVAAGKIRSYGVALGPAIGWRDEGLEVSWLNARAVSAV